MGQLVLGDEGHTDAEWEDAATARLPPEAFERQLNDAASYVACLVAQVRPGLLRSLWTTGTASAVPGSLATVSVVRDGVALEPRTFAGAMARPAGAGYVEADGRLVTTDGGSATVTVVGPPADAGAMPASLHDAIVEEAAAALYLTMGGDGPGAWGRATQALQDALR